MSRRIRGHLQRNVYGLVAIFIALGGTAFAVERGTPNSVVSGDIVNGQVKTNDISNSNGVRTGDVRNDTATGGGLLAEDLAPDSVGESEISNAPPFGSGGFNGDVGIIDGTVLGFDIGTNTVTESDLADSVGSAGTGTDTSCFDDDANGEICATTTFTVGEPGRVLVNSTGEWRTASGAPAAMTCNQQVDAVNIGLAQAFGETGTNHPAGRNGTMAMTGLTGTLAAGSHTFRLFCTQTDADLDLLNNQITAARVDG